VAAFVKNSGLGFAIPYLHNGRPHDFVPDFLVRVTGDAPLNLVLETKGYDPLKEVKLQAAQRWVAAVNADGQYGQWRFVMTDNPNAVDRIVSELR
jgi:type III restriction enzyme